MTDSLSTQEAYDKQRAELMAAIGECLMKWAYVEQKLSLLFQSRLGLNHELAFAMWDGVISFDAKRSMLDAVIRKTVTDEDITGVWNKLNIKLGKRARLRNEVAHGSVTNISDTECVLFPYGSMSKMIDRKARTLGVKELNERTLSFAAVAEAVDWTRRSMAARGRNASAVLPQTPGLIREIQTSTPQKPTGA